MLCVPYRRFAASVIPSTNSGTRLDYPSPPEERPYTTRGRYQPASSGGSVSGPQGIQYASSQAQPSTQYSGGRPAWQGSVVSSVPYPAVATAPQPPQTAQSGYATTTQGWQQDTSARLISGSQAGLAPVAGGLIHSTSRPLRGEIQGNSGEFEKLDPRKESPSVPRTLAFAYSI